MNQKIIFNWNSRVKAEDTVFFLGDWGFTKSTEAPDGQKFDTIRPLLNGNIVFIDGSHDKNNGCRTPIRNITIKHGGKIIFMVHDPANLNKDVIWNFCGHWHGKYGKFIKKGKNIIVDLSVENWNYMPVDINEINQAYSEWFRRGYKDEKKD
jgi:calcineurin-like phosphoesterase family protein